MIDFPSKSKSGKIERTYDVTGGQNQEDASSRLRGNEVEKLVNYDVEGDGRIISRKGYQKILSLDAPPQLVLGINSDLLAYFNDNGSETELYTYVISTGVATLRHTFSTNDQPCGKVAAGRVYASDGTDKLGYLELSTYTWNTITQAPACRVLDTFNYGYGECLVAGDLTVSGTDYPRQVWYCKADEDGNGSALSVWTPSQSRQELRPVGTPNKFSIQDTVKAFASSGNLLTVFGESSATSVSVTSGRVITFATADTITTEETNVLSVITIGEKQHQSGAYKAIDCDGRIYMVNNNGIKVGSYSLNENKEVNISLKLGKEELENIDFSDVDIAWNDEDKIYFCVNRDGERNNLILAYDIKRDAWSEITGWCIQRLCKLPGGKSTDMYGLASDGLYKLFEGYDDDGENIYGHIRFRQEDNGDPTIIKDARDFQAQGIIPEGVLVQIGMNKWDKRNGASESDSVYWWAGAAGDFEAFGYGITGYSSTINFGDAIVGENYVGRERPMSDFLKNQLDIRTGYRQPHEFHFFQFEYINKKRARPNNLTTTITE